MFGERNEPRTVVGWRGHGRTRPDGTPQAVVLVLHGGRSEGPQPCPRWNLARLRMEPFTTGLLRSLGPDGVAVGEVRYRVRGWNGERADAAVDATAAVRQVAERWGPVPVLLVGHSMGGRASLRAAADPAVTAVVALAPWCEPGDPYAQLAGKRLVTLHDVGDTVTRPEHTRTLSAAARVSGARVAGYAVHGSSHAMLGRARDWQRTTTGLVRGLLELGPLPDEVSAALALPGDSTDGLALDLPHTGRHHA